MSRDKSGNKAKGAEDRKERLAPPKADPKDGRERNVGHPDSEEHNRTPKGNRG
jgi:hypothetical protein